MVSAMDQYDEWLQPEDAARLLGVTPNTLRRWARLGLIGHIKHPSGRNRYSAADVDRIRRRPDNGGPKA